MLPVIALVGRPNVGKSTLFNRLTRTRDALVASFPGLTRDRQYGKGAMGDFPYIVVDTGGLSGDENGIDVPMADQAKQAIAEADLVLFLVDAKDGRAAGDENIAAMLRQNEIPTLLVANKIDGQNADFVAAEFYALGIGEPKFISASNGIGVGQLLDEEIKPRLQAEDAGTSSGEAAGIKIAVVGRPNVGKSTLVNRLLGEDRVVVFDEAGTTRDSIYIPYEREGKPYTIIDTAGVRRRGKVTEKIETFSIIKTLEAISDAHVVILMVDAQVGIVDQDLHLLGHMTQQMQILIYDTHLSINHQNDNMRIRNRLKRFDNRKSFDLFGDLSPAPNACCINDGVGFSFTLIGNVDTVPGGTSLIKNNNPVFTEQPIDQRGFTNIRAANDGYLNAGCFPTAGSSILSLQSWFNFFVQELPNTDAIACRNEFRLANT